MENSRRISYSKYSEHLGDAEIFKKISRFLRDGVMSELGVN